MFFIKSQKYKIDSIVDIHGHYAYEIDDGARSKEEFENLIQVAKENGVSEIILTPHIKPGRMKENWYELYQKRFDDISSKDYNIKFYKGCELMLNRVSLSYINKGLIFPIQNKYLLVEFSFNKGFDTYRSEYFDILYEIDILGYVPIIAHVERYFALGMTMEDVEEFKRKGYFIQINLQSLIKDYNNDEFKISKKLLKRNLVDFVASDSHNFEMNRLPEFNKIQEVLIKIVGVENAKALLRDNAQKILKGGIQ